MVGRGLVEVDFEQIQAAITDADCVALVQSLQRKLADPPPAQPDQHSTPTPEQWIRFLKYASDIKETKRTGWHLKGIPAPETVACHMYRMALMAALLTPAHLDRARCVEMALVHDLAEAIVGDITPDCGISREEKHRREAQALAHIVGCLGATTQEPARRVAALWDEYEEGRSAEADFVHQLDKLELALQVLEYERQHQARNLGDFLASASVRIADPQLRRIMDYILDESSQGADNTPAS